MSIGRVKDINIRMLPGNPYSTITLSYVSGSVDEKRILISDVIEQFIALINNEQMILFPELGRMPYGYINGKYKDSKNFSVILQVPETTVPVQYMGKVYTKIPFPSLVFALKFINGTLNTSLVRAGSLDSLSFYPFGNVYHNGRICWGGYKHEPVSCIADSEKTAHLFYELPTNNDLWNRSYVNSDVGVLSNMYDILNGMNRFPEEWLVRSNDSLDSLMNAI